MFPNHYIIRLSFNIICALMFVFFLEKGNPNVGSIMLIITAMVSEIIRTNPNKSSVFVLGPLALSERI